MNRSLTEVLPELMARPPRRRVRPTAATYPPFTGPTPAEARLAAAAARRLARQTGLNVRADQILVAPWIGRVVTPSGKRVSNSLGYRRDAPAYWRTYMVLHPTEATLLHGGRRVTPAFARAMAWPRSTVGQRLQHHHIGNGAFVFPLPVNVHQQAPVHGRATVVGR
jgi:HNH/Endo VII superfamily nuclease toxin with a HHH motif